MLDRSKTGQSPEEYLSREAFLDAVRAGTDLRGVRVHAIDLSGVDLTATPLDGVTCSGRLYLRTT